MKNKFTRAHIVASFLVHVCVFSFLAFFDDSSTIHRKFIVFGAHSKKTTRALYRPHNKPIPFVGDPKSFRRRRKSLRRQANSRRVAIRRKKARAKKTQTKKIKASQKKVPKKRQNKRNLKKENKRPQKTSQKRKPNNQRKKVQVKKVHVKKTPVKKIIPKTSLSQDKKTKKIKKKKINKPKKALAQKKKIVKQEVLNPKKVKKQTVKKLVKREVKKKKEKREKLLALQQKQRESEKKQKEKEVLKESEEDALRYDSKLSTQDDRALRQAQDDREDVEPEELQFSLLYETDPQMKKYQRSIQKEVARLWRPPVGVSKNTECRVAFEVNKHGNVERFEFLKRSKILIYDLSISRVAKKFAFNKCLWGKRFTIDFRQ